MTKAAKLMFLVAIALGYIGRYASKYRVFLITFVSCVVTMQLAIWLVLAFRR